ncbi:MAG: hypothetical protein ACO263_01120 [Cyclobacteriaceae bacterium]|jgi:hypothetical protein
MITRSTIILLLIMLLSLDGFTLQPEKRKKPNSGADPTLSMGGKQKKKLAKIKRKTSAKRK